MELSKNTGENIVKVVDRLMFVVNSSFKLGIIKKTNKNAIKIAEIINTKQININNSLVFNLKC